MIALTYRRPDGTFVADINGLPYHVISSDDVYWPAAFAEAQRLGSALPYEPKPPAITPPIPTISRRQFFQQAAIEGDVSHAEALAAVQFGAIPPPMQVFVEALPVAERFAAQMMIAGASEFDPSHKLSVGYALATGRTPEQKEQFFRNAAVL